MNKWIKRLLAMALLSTLAVVALYAWFARVYVNSDSFRQSLAGDDRAVSYTFESARSSSPGVLDVERLVIIGRDKGQSRWRLDIDKTRLEIELAGLWHRDVLIRKAEG